MNNGLNLFFVYLGSKFLFNCLSISRKLWYPVHNILIKHLSSLIPRFLSEALRHQSVEDGVKDGLEYLVIAVFVVDHGTIGNYLQNGNHGEN